MSQRPILERAFEIVRGGDCFSTQDLRARLRAEGYGGIEEALYGPSLQKQLKRMCAEARRASAGADPLIADPSARSG